MTATTAPDGADDFSARLEVAEVYGLDLRQADLVVLSACETNLGALSNGDDLVGLTRAFFFAGTPSVVASLWRVPDDATQQLMMQFYTHLRAGVGKAEALRQAQRDMRQYRDDVGRQPYAAPYYWASFVLVGEGTGALVAVPWWQRVSWWGWAAALGAIVAVAVVSLFWNRLQKTSRSM
jgi:CHAT domain-containing protein